MIIQDCCQLLEQHQLKIAFLESASSGYLCSQFSIYKNSGAEIFLGGLVCYDPKIKVTKLGISPDLIQRYSAESMEVTEALAYAGQQYFEQANVVVACTGLLKPGGSAHVDKPEGTFFISIHYANQTHNFQYYLEGTPQQRLDALCYLVAQEIISLIQTHHRS